MDWLMGFHFMEFVYPKIIITKIIIDFGKQPLYDGGR